MTSTFRPAKVGGRLDRLRAGFTAAPAYPASDADRRTVRIAGVDLPLRATTALFVATFVILFDYSRTAIPKAVLDLNLSAAAARYQAIERLILFGLVPILVIVLAFRDRPREYGIRIGDWRWGLSLAVLGCAVMTPIVLALVADPGFAAYYRSLAASVTAVAITNGLDLAPSEFLFRGFLMFTLVRGIGPVGIVVAQLPFVFSHLSKPELELFSTLFGGLVYGWLNWRTGSILWSVLAHVYIVTLAITAAGLSGA